MPDEDRSDITELLRAWSSGDEAALSDLMPKVYPELRRVARKHLARGLPGHTLESVLRMSPETAKRDWKMAKAWLLRELSGGRSAN